MKKVCSKCKTEKDYSEYHKSSRSKTGIQTICKQCNIHNRKQYYKTHPEEKNKIISFSNQKLLLIKEFFNKIKSDNKCCFCNESNFVCLDFHHLFDKNDDVSRLINKKSMKKALLEIKKCIVVCANCHRKIHAGLLDCSDKKPLS